MNIAIIGGSGFVGTKLMDLLAKKEGIKLLNIDKANSDKHAALTRICNVMDEDRLRDLLSGIDLVVLLAAEHRDDVSPVSKYYEVNVKGLENTLQAMETNGVKRIVFASSVAVYGLDKENPSEDAPLDPFNHYGRSKLQAEKVLESWYQSHPDWNINIIRPTVIFGEGNRGNVYNLLKQIATGQFMMIGKGDNQKSMSYVGNIVAFIQFLIQDKRENYNVYNYGDKPDLSTKELVSYTGNFLEKTKGTIQIPYWLGMIGGYGFDVLAFFLRRKLAISSIRVRKFCAVTQYNSEKAMDSGFIPPYTLREGLEKMLEQEFIQLGQNKGGKI